VAIDKKFLWQLLGTPTAPFRERQIRSFFIRACEKHSVPYFEDPVGNIVLGVSSKVEYLKLLSKKSKEPVRMFIAHMDHPGFHGVRFVGKNRLEAKWYGGAPQKHLTGARVWLSSDEGITTSARILSAKVAGHTINTLSLRLNEPREEKASALYGGFGFRSPIWQEKELLYTKAADDLVGAFCVFSVAKRWKRGKPFIGLLTRAEEVGFIGMIAHLELEWWKKARRPLLAVSLETSRTLPGAYIGKGPVVRLGDRATPFNPDGVHLLTQIAKKKLGSAFQRRIMDGGTCEATAATAFGIPAIGISIPLGNYHNQSFEGGPDSGGKLGPAPEFVHQKDIEGMLKLCEGLMQKGLPWEKPWLKRESEFRALRRKSTRLLSL
jgi:putative aminopeptidase FrvX